MDRFFDRLGDLLRGVLGEGAGAGSAGTRRARPGGIDDPDLAAAWDELERYLDDEDDATEEPAAETHTGRTAGAAGAGGGPHRSDRQHAGVDPQALLRAAYATLEVGYGAPFDEVKRSYKRLMRTHHPDRYGADATAQAAATKRAARINAAFKRIEDHARG